MADLTTATRQANEYLRLANYPVSFMSLLKATQVGQDWHLTFEKFFSSDSVVTVVVDHAGHVTSLTVESKGGVEA